MGLRTEVIQGSKATLLRAPGTTVDFPRGMTCQSGDWGSSVEGGFRGRA